MKRHLIGIGGVGMSALAVTLANLGDEVTGADRTLGTKTIRHLESLGIQCYPDDGSGVDGTVDEVIVSSAIEENNPGLEAAKAFGIPVTHRAVALARALGGKKLVAVAGTCGKSTVTAMLGHIMAACGLDPLCVNGANVVEWGGAVRFGRGEYAVAEVDESDKSLVAFHPYAAIITNSSADHYSKDEMDRVFDNFIADVKGPVIDGRLPDDSGLAEPQCSMPGEHNRANALLALRMAVALGCDEAKARAALKSFGGVERRMQRYGENVYDDYAHNPEKLRAMWNTLVSLNPGRGICVAWRPHGYGPLRKMLGDLADMFNKVVRECDKLILLPVYDAGGTADRTINSSDLADMLRPGLALCMNSLDAVYEWMHARKENFATFAVCGARDPDLPLLAAKLGGMDKS